MMQQGQKVPTAARPKEPYVIEEEFGYNPDQERADDGKFGSGGGSGGGGLPKNDSHTSKLPAPKTHNSEDPHHQIKWAGEKSKEQNRPVFVTPNKRTGPGQGPHALAFKPPTKGDYHAVHPDGRITFHPGAPTKPKATKAHTVGFARSCEAFAAGGAPHSVRLWRAGWNVTDKGDVNFTPRSAQLVMADYARRGNPLVFDYEHESLLPLEKRGGSPMRGVSSAPSAVPEIRNDAAGRPELWASSIGWTDEAKRQIESGERRQISPVCDFDRETGEVLNLRNVALCREGATHSGTLLASVAKGTSTMEELIKAICDAAVAGDFKKVVELGTQADGGGPPMAKPEPAAAAPPAHQPPAAMAAYSRELSDAKTEAAMALKEARTGRVEGMIAASRECFDAADEQVHLRRADPDATREHIASFKRKLTAGTLAATRSAVELNPPKNKPDAENDTHGLAPFEIATAVQNKVSLADYAASKKRHAESLAARGKVS